MFCFVAVKGWVSLFDVRSTFLQKQKKSGGRTVSTWQGIDRGEDNWCSRLTCSYFGERDASGACVALGINIELILVPHQEYLFAHKQPFCSFFLGCVFQVNSQQISISAFPTSHLPSGRIQLEKKKIKKSYSVGIWILLLLFSLALLPFLSRACFLKEKRTYQPKDSIATFSSLSPMGRKLKLN